MNRAGVERFPNEVSLSATIVAPRTRDAIMVLFEELASGKKDAVR